MQFLTDENVPASLVKALRAKGFSVKDVKEEKLFGIKDGPLMDISRREQRVIITLDKDFATYPTKSHYGVVLLRYGNKNVQNMIKRFSEFLDSRVGESLEKSLCEIFDTYVKIHRQ